MNSKQTYQGEQNTARTQIMLNTFCKHEQLHFSWQTKQRASKRSGGQRRSCPQDFCYSVASLGQVMNSFNTTKEQNFNVFKDRPIGFRRGWCTPSVTFCKALSRPKKHPDWFRLFSRVLPSPSTCHHAKHLLKIPFCGFQHVPGQ